MANTISLSIDISITDEGVLNDETVFLAPARANVGVFVKAFKVSYTAAQTEIPIAGNNSDPETDDAWLFDIATDGWYQFYYISIPDYDVGITYAEHDAVFDPATGNVYRSISDLNVGNSLVNTLWFELIDDPASLVENIDTATESENTDGAVYQRILTPKVDRLYGDVAVVVARECCSDCETEENVDRFELVFALREGALISEERMEYADGEKMIRRLDEFVAS